MILLLTYTMYGNARWDDNIIYMSKVITVGLYIKVIVQPCNQEKVASSNCENYKWLVWKFHHKTFNFGRLLQLKVKKQHAPLEDRRKYIELK
jgi:hypothetical protein